jgi:nucleoside-diphosphate-sugar epimerase
MGGPAVFFIFTSGTESWQYFRHHMNSVEKEQTAPAGKALVTGASGFIGGRLVEKLLAGGFHVRCLVRRPWKPRIPPQGGTLECIRGDLSRKAVLREALEGIRLVFHVAGLTAALKKRDYFLVNRDGTANLLDALTETDRRIDRLVYVSSLAAAGPASGGAPALEDTAPHPVSQYGRSKLEAERLITALGPSIPWTIIRPPIVYGEREKQLFQFIRMMARGVLPLPSGQDRLYSFIHVDDLVSGLLLAAARPEAAGEIYYMAHREILSWEAFTMAVTRALGKKVFRISLPLTAFRLFACLSELSGRIRGKAYPFNCDKYREMRHLFWICDPGKAEKTMGFRARIGLDEGAARAVKWYRQAGWLSA